MSNSNSPFEKLHAEANKMAKHMKAMYRREIVVAGRDKPEITIGIMQDDKFIKMTVAWECIGKSTEKQIRDFVLQYTQGEKK